MTIHIFTFTSPIHDKKAVDKATQAFLQELGAHLPKEAEVSLLDTDYEQYGNADLDLLYIRTGGTEGLFRQWYTSLPADARPQHLYLLTSGKSNSLAASMEILSWLNQQQVSGEILHGESADVARRITLIANAKAALRKLSGQKAGIIGKPSDWLISSDADREIVKQKLGVELVDIEMEELLAEIKKHDYPVAARRRIKTCPSDYFVGALEIYGALKRLIKKYQLSALTIRCFDLLSTVKNTGCLALALLNEEGIPSSCEGDVPALLTMMIAQQLTGVSGFQANPSRINPLTGEMLFAHCTVPFNMLKDYHWDTHFESGIGVAIHGELPEGAITLAKVSGNLSRHFAVDAQLDKNQYESDLCRTQIVVKAPGTGDYFLKNPIGNHHIILPGHVAEQLEVFMEMLK